LVHRRNSSTRIPEKVPALSLRQLRRSLGTWFAFHKVGNHSGASFKETIMRTTNLLELTASDVMTREVIRLREEMPMWGHGQGCGSMPIPVEA
jgi:hypothetical protein